MSRAPLLNCSNQLRFPFVDTLLRRSILPCHVAVVGWCRILLFKTSSFLQVLSQLISIILTLAFSICKLRCLLLLPLDLLDL